MEMNDLTVSVLCKIFNKTEEEVKASLFDADGKVIESAFDNIVAMDAARVKRLKDDGTTRFNDGYKKAQAEVLRDNETLLKETFGINDDLTYPELLIRAKELSASKSKLTVDDVKKHPEYLALESTRIKKEDHDKVVNELTDKIKSFDRTMKMQKVIDKATAKLNEFNPDFTPYSDAPQIKNNLIDNYKRSFEQFDDFEITDTAIIPIKDGKRVEDEHGNPISFDALCKQNASNYFKFLKQGAKGNAGNGNGGEPTPTDLIFTSKEDMTLAYSKITDPAKQKEFIANAKVAAN